MHGCRVRSYNILSHAAVVVVSAWADEVDFSSFFPSLPVVHEYMGRNKKSYLCLKFKNNVVQEGGEGGPGIYYFLIITTFERQQQTAVGRMASTLLQAGSFLLHGHNLFFQGCHPILTILLTVCFE